MTSEEKRRRRYESNKEEVRRQARLRNKIRREENPEREFAIKHAWYLKNRAKLRANRLSNICHVRKVEADYQRRRRKNDANYRLQSVLRSRVAIAVRKNSKAERTMNLLGCTIAKLKKHLESLWKPGMNWGNWSRTGWHIDHIRPISSFDMNDKEQQKQCFHWTNLQPLWALENHKKSDIYEGSK
jgi:hypothetical protein